MAFTNEKLGDVVAVTSGSTSTLATVSSSKKVYIRSIMAYDVNGSAATAYIYVVPNGGTAGSANKMFNIDLNTQETALIEPIYPIVLDTTGDTLVVGANGGTINFFAVGDREA